MDTAGTTTAAAGSAGLNIAGGIISMVTSLGSLALTIFAGQGEKQVWTADMFAGAANNGKYTGDEATLLGIGASVLVIFIVAIILILTK